MRNARRHLTFREARCLISLYGCYSKCIDISTFYQVDYASTRFYFFLNTWMLKPCWTSWSLRCPWPFRITPLNCYYLTSYWFLYFPVDQIFQKGKGNQWMEVDFPFYFVFHCILSLSCIFWHVVLCTHIWCILCDFVYLFNFDATLMHHYNLFNVLVIV